MDPVTNPFAPGAGTRPPEMAGRRDLLEVVRIALENAVSVASTLLLTEATLTEEREKKSERASAPEFAEA